MISNWPGVTGTLYDDGENTISASWRRYYKTKRYKILWGSDGWESFYGAVQYNDIWIAGNPVYLWASI